jgi:hypothetical protein
MRQSLSTLLKESRWHEKSARSALPALRCGQRFGPALGQSGGMARFASGSLHEWRQRRPGM